MKINISNWEKFKVGDLFTCKNTGNILVREVIEDENGINFVTAQSGNNGVAKKIELKAEYEVIPGGCIFIGGKTFTVNYQGDDFVSNDSHNLVLRYKHEKPSKRQYLFMVSVISKIERFKWNDAVTGDALLQQTILLPAGKTGKPDLDYMEEFMKKIEYTAERDLDILQSATQK